MSERRVVQPTLLRLLEDRARETPHQVVLTFLEDGDLEARSWTWARLDRRARSVASRLEQAGLVGQRALLLYPPGLDFVAAFLGCLYSGTIAVPAYPPRLRRSEHRLEAIARDCRPAACLVPESLRARVEILCETAPELLHAAVLVTDTIGEDGADGWLAPDHDPQSLAFLQYTSGSTSTPKGVRVTHANLFHNEEMIACAFGQSQASVVVGWLPLYHDMGLIGNLLQPLYSGSRCVLMAPTAFLQQPIRWLRAISRYRATTSGGPNFAYELCLRRIAEEELADLDLSCWKVAFNGAEPVRNATMERFAERFAVCGFERRAFLPCYGLAEGTLLVASGAIEREPTTLSVDPAALEAHVARPAEGDTARTLVSCGGAWGGQQVLIVDPETGRALPETGVGEIWVRGASIADGYWERPEVTAELFEARSAQGEGPFLRTGDLGFLVAGELYVTGRIKDLIILRGRNLYPQDVEATAERAHPDLRPGGGAAFAIEVAQEERLVVVHEIARRATATEPIAAAIRQAVAAEHEALVHEVVLIREGTLPKTSSGKVQRRACRDDHLAGRLEVVASSTATPETEIRAELAAEPPTNAAIGVLAREAARLLGVAVVDARRPLGAQGLDSLAAIELGHAVAKHFGVVPELGEMLADLTLEQLAAQLAPDGETVRRPAPAATPQPTVFGLAHGQRALVFLERLAPQDGAYNVAAAARLRGELDVATLAQAAVALARRHPQLRAVVIEQSGELCQQITQTVPAVEVIDPTGFSTAECVETLRRQAFAPFDLARGPLLRIAVLRCAPSEHLMLLAVHHTVADFWSLALAVDELARLYRGESPGPALGRSYADFVAAQQRWLAEAAGRAALEFWRATLAGPPAALELPTDRPRPAVQSFAGDSVALRLAMPVAESLRALARRSGATLFMVLQALWGCLLHRASQQTEVWVGTPTAGRGDPELAGVVGYFVNPIVVRQRFAAAGTFAAHLAAVRAAARAAYPHQSYPFALLAELLQGERDPSRSPLFQTMLIFQSAPGRPGLAALALGEEVGGRMSWADLELEPVKLPRRPVPFDLSLSMAELASGELAGSLQVATRLFDMTTARRLAAALVQLVEAVAAAPERRIGELALLGKAARHQLVVELCDNDFPAAEPLLPAAFAARVARTPDTPALLFGRQTLSYGELDRRARRLARRLAELGAGPGAVVGVALERSIELAIALWAVLETGAAYLPLDPAYPAERLRFVAADAGVSLILAQARTAASLRGTADGAAAPRVIVLENEAEHLETGAAIAAPAGIVGTHPAYVIYTSGSTGRPKGVVVPHAAVANFFAGMDRRLAGQGGVRSGSWLAVTSISFDISVLELLWTLTRGLTVVVRRAASSALSAPLVSRLPQHPLAFSLMYFSSDVDVAPGERYRLLLEGAKLADREGFEAVWTPERHFHAFGGLFPNPSVTSAALAALTRNVRIRAGSVVLPLHHPVRVAEEWAVVDNLSGGRVGLAFASGWQPDDFVLAPASYGERKEALRRGLETVRELWRGGAVELPNGIGQTSAVRILPRPIQPELPVWITAAGSAETFELAGATGSAVLTHLLGQSFEDLAAKLAIYRQAFRRSGAAGRGHVTLMLHAFVEEDAARVRELVREPFTRYLRTSFGLMKSLAPGQDLDAMTEDDMTALLARAFDRYFETSGFFGTPERCLEIADRLKELGVDEVACLIDFGVDTDAVLASLAQLTRVKNAANPYPGAVEAERELSPCEEILHRRISHLQCTPSLARALLTDPQADAALGALSWLMVGGEALAPDLAAALAAKVGGRLLNMYGPTETTIWSSVASIANGAAITLGEPIVGTSLVVVDRRLELVGLGVPGELLIGGAGVARGYHGRPRLCAERFIPDPFGERAGARLYRTGDLVRRRHDGRPEFLGRIDHQVKIRGHRIELGEVETAILARDDVREAVVVAREDRPGDVRLVAYVVPAHLARAHLGEPPAERRERLLAERGSYRLPNGLTVAHLTSPQTSAIYREIWIDDVYDRHGVTLTDGATIFDVGANIGLFTLWVHQRCPGARVFAFEPIPPTFATLAVNAELYGLDVELFNLGISEREETASFTFYPEMAGLSGRFSEGDRATTRSIIRSWIERTRAERADVATVGEAELDAVVDAYLRSESFECRLRPLSAIFGEHAIESVDLLKIDVEGAEIQVLRGIADSDWPKIRQIIIEVHSKQLLAQAEEILAGQGFALAADEFIPVADQIDYVYMLYAVRPEARQSVAAMAPVFSAAALRAALAAQLPEPMVPGDVVVLDRLPLLPNGKVDRRALPAPSYGAQAARRTPFEPPGEGLEMQIAAVWRELLGLGEVSIHDNFFESGGTSLLLMQAHGRLREVLGRELSLVDLMRHPTIATLARHLHGDDARAATEQRQKQTDERMARQRQAFGRRRERHHFREGQPR